MNSVVKALVGGGVTFVVGLALWMFTGDIETPVVTLTKLGVVLMALGALEVVYGLYKGVVGSK
ncbi:DUF5708 family protein [Streptomyces sp. NPDC050263]|uniref:DUF5708 family protein n=1 Tax=Streptomyces sp. NPDC050263 TaxID=3155037 RepID=UPI0034307977